MAKAQKDTANYLKEVREQYEHYPYPVRYPQNEKTVFQYGHMSALDCLNHFHFGGKRDFSRGFRALTAGDGTGDATIMLAEQLRDTDAEIIYLDISEASMQVAQARAKVRGLTNITWLHGSLLDASKMLDGTFDYINCGGVLHHLESPEAGLKALTKVLKNDGVMGLMLYAKYGREGVYQVQKLMRILNQHEPDMQRKIENCKSVLNRLPASHAFWRIDEMAREVREAGDVGIYDLLLHSNDVAYSVPELYAFLATSKLHLTHFFFANHPEGNDLYKLETYVNDARLTPIIQTLSPMENQAAAELMHGQIIKHMFYAAKTSTSVPRVEDLDNVPYFYMLLDQGAYAKIHQGLMSATVGQTLSWQLHGGKVDFAKTPNLERICQAMDGNKTLAEIFKEVIASYPAHEQKPTTQELKNEFAEFFAAFNKQNWMYLRNKSAPKVKTLQDIHGRR